MNLIQAFVRHPVSVSVGVLLVALFGAIGLARMPMQLTPEVEAPNITIETFWPGASPEEVEREIVHEQEEQLKSVEGVLKMSSESADSRGRITLEFAVGTDLSEAVVKVNSRLNQVKEYPVDADQPVVSTSNAADRSIAWIILAARVPEPEQIASLGQRHPELAEKLAWAQRAVNPALTMYRLRRLAEENPLYKELLPPDSLEITKMRRLAENEVEAALERVDGISNSDVMGGREDEMQIVIDPHRLAARQVTLDDLRQALAARNLDISGGDLWEGKRQIIVRTMGQFRSQKQVLDVVLARRDGAPVYVRDVATVQLGYKKPDGFVRRYGENTIAINAQRETGANVLEVMKGIRQAIQDLNEGSLKQHGVQLFQVYDETDYIYSAVGLVNSNIVSATVLTILVLLLFLKSFRSTLVVALAVPTSLIGTFLILDLLGRSLNVISLAGLAFAVGMLVDNAIVVLENIYRHYQMGRSPMSAAVAGTQEVWGAVVASTLTTLAIFLPVVFIQEEAGQLFRDIALAVSGAVGLSLIVSVTLVPTAAARLLRRAHPAETDPAAGHPREPASRGIPTPHEERLAAERAAARAAYAKAELLDLSQSNGHGEKPHSAAHGKSWSAQAKVLAERVCAPFDRLGQFFVRWVVGVNAYLQRSWLHAGLFCLACLIVSVGLSWLLLPKVEYLPTGNRNLVMGFVQPPAGYNLSQLEEVGNTLERRLEKYWSVDPGTPEAEALGVPPIADFFFMARGRSTFLGIRAAEPLRVAELIPVILQGGAGLPGVDIVAKQSSLFERGLTAGRTVDIEIMGPELEHLRELATRIKAQVEQSGSLAIARPSLDAGAPEVHINPKWDQSADLQMTTAELGYAVDCLVDGAYAGDYYYQGDKIDLTIVGEDRFARHTQDLNSLPVATRSGQLVPLDALANLRMRLGPEQINHRERQRAITVQAIPPPQMALEDVLNHISQNIVEPLRVSGELDGGYRIQLAGTADKLRATWNALWFNLVLAFLITYLLMAALFESWLYPLVIITSVPLGAVGGIGALWILNLFVLQPLDVLTMLGFVILIGTVVNNPILIVHQALNHMREDFMSPDQAILESVSTRIRPIFMTTTTTVIGLLPLAVAPGAGSELYRGLGSVVLGGLVVSTLVSLILVPALFGLTMRAKDACHRFLVRVAPWLVSTEEHDLLEAPSQADLAALSPAPAATEVTSVHLDPRRLPAR